MFLRNTPISIVCLLFVVSLLCSCSSPRNSLSQPIQPLPVNEGDLKVSASFGGFSDANFSGNVQAAYALKEKISVGVNVYGIGPETKGNRGDNYAKSFMGEAFVGTNWFKPLKVYGAENQVEELSTYNGILFDLSTGFGINNLRSQPASDVSNDFSGYGPFGYGLSNNGDFKYHTRYAFLQAGILVRSKWVDVGMSLRGVGLKYISGEVNGQRFSNRQDQFINQAEKDGVFTFLETAFRFSAGSPKVKVFTSVSVVSNVFGDETMVHLPRPLMIGLEFNLNEFSKKKEK